MLKHLVSPKFTHRKLEPPFYRDVVDVFEDRMRGWLLSPAMHLLKSTDYSIAAVSLATSYFEGIEIFYVGEDSEGKSKRFFRSGFQRVFQVRGQSQAVQDAVADRLYSLLRCGFAHDAMFRSGVHFSTVRKEPLLISYKKKDGVFDPASKLESVVIHPELFVQGIERHFSAYISKLRHAKDESLKRNFERAIEIKWKLGQPGSLIAMTQEQFVTGELPGED